MGPGDFTENVIIEGIPLLELKVGDCLRLGETAILEIAQIGKEDHPSIVTRTFGVTGDGHINRLMPREYGLRKRHELFSKSLKLPMTFSALPIFCPPAQ